MKLFSTVFFFPPNITFIWFLVWASSVQQKARWNLPNWDHAQEGSSIYPLLISHFLLNFGLVHKTIQLTNYREWHWSHHIWIILLRCIDCCQNFRLMTHRQTHFHLLAQSSFIFQSCSTPSNNYDWKILQKGLKK